MHPQPIIEEAKARLQELETEIIAPKFWDRERARVQLGVRRRAPEAILADIDAYTGVYPVVSSTVQTGQTVTSTNPSSDGSSRSNNNSKTLEEGGIEDDGSSNDSEEDVFKQKFPELAALLENIPEASVSLWLVPAAHACVSGVTGRAEQDGDRSEPRRSPSLHEDPEAPHARTIGEAEGKPIRLDLQELLRGSGARQAGAQRESSWLSEALQGRALRVALDVVLGNCRPVRRTGTVLLRDLEQARSGFGWPVSWDNPQWFKGARVGLNFTHETGSCQHAALSPGLQAEGHMEIKRRPFLYLVWVYIRVLTHLLATSHQHTHSSPLDYHQKDMHIVLETHIISS
ncbi:hypothetical protein C8Q76DRAFT_790231 [Earliella scabrosa]|nr:hypothetical protein C8Q76DRAFT_790231 [Earliella scabrosa]